MLFPQIFKSTKKSFKYKAFSCCLNVICMQYDKNMKNSNAVYTGKAAYLQRFRRIFAVAAGLILLILLFNFRVISSTHIGSKKRAASESPFFVLPSSLSTIGKGLKELARARSSRIAREESSCFAVKGSWCQQWDSRDVIPWKPPPQGDQQCLWNCNNVGVCDATAGWCRCSAGWRGDACDERMPRRCSQYYRKHGFEPYGKPLDWGGPYGIHARCAGQCDEDIGMCFCPSNTTYGRQPASESDPPGTPPKQYGRPMGYHCQPSFAPNGSKTAVGTVHPDNLTGPDGWCNAKAPSHRCPCYMDGLGGMYCETILEQVCLNQCNGHGDCESGWCRCHAGWFGQDCAYRTLNTSWALGLEAERPWLKLHVHTPAAQDPPPAPTRTRPLIYVYELPPMYNQLLLQYRVDAHSCVHRQFSGKNDTMFTQWTYNLEVGLHEFLLQSDHRTLDPEEADFFYLPIYTSCHAHPVYGFNDFPWFHGGPGGNRAHGATNMMIEAWSWIRSHYPYWNRKGGVDHIVLTTHDEGSCYVPEVLRPAIVLAHWGYTGLNNESFTAYMADDFSREYAHPVYQPEGHLAKLGKYPCYNSSKDLVVPLMWSPSKYISAPLFGAPTRNRTILAFHKGRIQQDFPRYSRGVRQKLGKLAKEKKWWDKHKIYFGNEFPPDMKSLSYSDLLASSLFCLVVMGDGWSARFDDAVVHGCIPVILMEDVHVGFESILDVAKFSLRFSPFDDLKELPKLLKAVSKEEIKSKQLALSKVWRRYFYSGYRAYNATVTQYLEKQRKRREKENPEVWSLPAPEADFDPSEGDAFATILQWLNSRKAALSI